MSQYLGRIVAVGLTQDGRACAMYRVSSRSFPNREAIVNAGKVAIVPKAGFENDLRINPYIAYNCIRSAGKYMVATNGSQTDPIVEKIAQGMSPRDAITLGLLAMDYEKDSLDTPRIVAVMACGETTGFLGIIRKDAVLVREMKLQKGQLFYLSTYNCNRPCDSQMDDAFDATDAAEACNYVIQKGVFAEFTNPVTAACAVATSENTFEVAIQNA